MTMTETRPEETMAAAPSAALPVLPSEQPGELPGLLGWLMTVDHKRIGRIYVAVALLALIGGLVVGGLLGLERIDPTGASILKLHTVAQLYSLYQLGLAFLVVIPLLLGIAIAIVPLQVGARRIAFPRAAALSVWCWLAGSVIFVVGYSVNGGPGGGNGKGVNLFLTGFAAIVFGLLLGAVCVATTVLTNRGKGQSLWEVPAFAWSALVTSSLLLLTLPVLLANLIFLWVDHKHGQVAFGGSSGMWAYLTWVVRQPQTYLFALPALGIVADIVPVAARNRARLAKGTFVAIGIGGALAIGTYTQTAFTPKVTTEALFIAMALGAILAPMIIMATSLLTLRTGKPAPSAALIWAFGSLLMALAGAAAGALTPFKGLELQGTVYETGQMHLVLLGGGVLGAMAALTYWGPKLWGRKLPSGPNTVLALLGVAAVALIALPDLVAGFLDQPAGEVNFDKFSGAVILNVLTFAGTALLLLVVLAFGLLALRAFGRSGESAGDDPWGGHTLEWATTSPPPLLNFADAYPEVSSPQPLLDRKEA